MTTLAHHFDDAEQQHESMSLGMWAFLVTEIMFFGGLFLGYTVYRSEYPGAFLEGSHHLDVTLGTVNTAVLILSSLTIALSIRAAQLNSIRGQVFFLLATILLGLVFLGIKVVEYEHKFTEHLFPGAGFARNSASSPQVELFFCFYFAMTGMHALHMVIGIVILAILVVLAYKGRFNAEWHDGLEVMGLYWHFVDCVWIFLFPLLYLLGRQG